jgi:hypothetical protein
MVTNSEKGPNEEEHMISTVSFIRRRVARPRGVLMGLGALAGAAALVLAGTTSATATPRGAMAQAKAELAQGPRAETVSSLDLQSFVAKTTSTTGVKLYVSFDASNVIGFPKYDSADVILDNLNSSEGHLWSFPIGKRAFVPKSSGAGSFRTGSAFGAYGSVAVTFTPTASKRIEVCNATNYVRDQTERVRGTFFFDSHSTGRHAWGKVGSKTKAFSFKGQTNLFTGYSSGLCTPKTSVGACYSQVSWSATTVTDKPQSKSVTFSGSVGDGPTDMDATREVNGEGDDGGRLLRRLGDDQELRRHGAKTNQMQDRNVEGDRVECGDLHTGRIDAEGEGADLRDHLPSGRQVGGHYGLDQRLGAS